jgi:metal-responsive CopG/Arc/MetJ family transcriptional regulator
MVIQINLRMNDKLHSQIKEYSETFGYENLQDFIREVMREKVFESNDLTEREIGYASVIEKLSDNNKAYGSMKDIKALIKKKQSE